MNEENLPQPSTPPPPATEDSPGTPRTSLPWRLVLWSIFLAAIVAGAAFQGTIVRGLEGLIPPPTRPRKLLYWASHHDPTRRFDRPGKDAKGMDLVPVYEGQEVAKVPLIEPEIQELRTLPETVTVFPEKTVGGLYVDFKIDRAEAARYGMNVQDVQDIILSALGGTNVTKTVEGLERYPVNVRYPRELRDNLTTLRQTLIATPQGAHIPIEQVADLEVHTGPPVIRSEQAKPNAWIYVDVATSDIGGYVSEARRLIEETVVN